MTSHTETHVTTIIANAQLKNLTNEVISDFAAQLGTDAPPVWLAEGEACDLFHPPCEAPLSHPDFDVVTQPVEGRKKALLVSDMDSTLIEQECIDELADALQIKPQVAAITERAMNGELDFEAALRARVAMLKELPEATLQHVYETQISLMPGAKTLAATMKAHGAYLLLVSGGFTFFTTRIKDALGFDEDRSNQLACEDGRLTGAVIEPVLGAEAKYQALQETLSWLKLSAGQSLAVGDGANDLPMLKAAGLGVAYRAKPHVQQQVHACINHADLSALLYLQGYPRSAWVT